jgi:hypothetical protein
MAKSDGVRQRSRIAVHLFPARAICSIGLLLERFEASGGEEMYSNSSAHGIRYICISFQEIEGSFLKHDE